MDKRYYKIIDGKTVFYGGEIIIIGEMQIINPTEEQLVEAGWQIYVEPPVPEPTPQQLLQEAKAMKLAEIDDYNNSTSVNSFMVNGYETWIPVELRAVFKTSLDAYIALDQPTMTKIWDGVEYTTSPQNWLQMYYRVEFYANECQNVTDRHKIAVNAMTNIEDVEGFDITAGYPERLEFSI